MLLQIFGGKETKFLTLSISGGSSIGGKMRDEFGTGQNLSAKAKEPNLSMKKKSTFSDWFEDNKSSKIPEQEQSQTRLKTPSVLRPTDSISRNASRKPTYTAKNETKVDEWERAKVEKIRTR